MTITRVHNSLYCLIKFGWEVKVRDILLSLIYIICKLPSRDFKSVSDHHWYQKSADFDTLKFDLLYVTLITRFLEFRFVSEIMGLQFHFFTNEQTCIEDFNRY